MALTLRTQDHRSGSESQNQEGQVRTEGQNRMSGTVTQAIFTTISTILASFKETSCPDTPGDQYQPGGVSRWYSREIGRVDEANQVAEQRGAVAVDQVESGQRYCT